VLAPYVQDKLPCDAPCHRGCIFPIARAQREADLTSLPPKRFLFKSPSLWPAPSLVTLYGEMSGIGTTAQMAIDETRPASNSSIADESTELIHQQYALPLCGWGLTIWFQPILPFLSNLLACLWVSTFTPTSKEGAHNIKRSNCKLAFTIDHAPNKFRRFHLEMTSFGFSVSLPTNQITVQERTQLDHLLPVLDLSSQSPTLRRSGILYGGSLLLHSSNRIIYG